MIRLGLFIGILLHLGFSITSSDPYALDAGTFFASPKLHQHIELTQPDTALLDAALFHATNEARQCEGLPLFHHDPSLHRAAASHAEAMIERNFYGHDNPYSPTERTAEKRIHLRTRAFKYSAENIAEYQIIDTPDLYGSRRNWRVGKYEYLDLKTIQPCAPYTYATYARHVVDGWMNSPSHRVNLLSTLYTHLGCAARISQRPFQERRAPFARLVQDFGGD